MRLSMGRVETRGQNYAGRDAAPVAYVLHKASIHCRSLRNDLESYLRFFLFAQRRRNPRVPHISRIVDNARTRFCWRTRLELAAGSDWAKQRKTVDGGMVVRDLLFRICDFSGRF